MRRREMDRYEKEYVSTNKQVESPKGRMMGKEGRYGNFNNSKTAETYSEDWSAGQEGAMKQYDNGSMDYYNRKNSLDRADEKKISSAMLPQ